MGTTDDVMPPVSGRIVVQLGARRTRRIGGGVLVGWLGLLALGWLGARGSARGTDMFLCAVAAGPPVVAALSRAVWWYVARVLAPSQLARRPLQRADVEGWFREDDSGLILISSRQGDLLWVHAKGDRVDSALRAWLAGADPSRLRACAPAAPGIAGWGILSLPAFMMLATFLATRLDSSYASLLSLLFLGPIVLCIVYLVSLLSLIVTESLEVIGQDVVAPSGRRVRASELRLERTGARRTPGRLRFLPDGADGDGGWSFQPARILRAREREALGLDEAEALRRVVEDRGRQSRTVHRE